MIAADVLAARESDVLQCLRLSPGIHYLQAAGVCRLLNLNDPCEWCRVLPPKSGESCAVVPKESLRKVKVILNRLVRHGSMEHSRFGVFKRRVYRLVT